MYKRSLRLTKSNLSSFSWRVSFLLESSSMPTSLVTEASRRWAILKYICIISADFQQNATEFNTVMQQSLFPLLFHWCVLMSCNKQQHTKKLMSNSPRLTDINVGLVDFILHLPMGKGKFWVNFLEKNNLIHRTVENFFGFVKITSGLVNPGYSLPWKIESNCKYFYSFPGWDASPL